MPYEIIRQDITKMEVDAIVDPTDYMFSGGGGTDRDIHRAAGPGLREACDALPFLEEGEVAVTEGFGLPCRYIIHAYGPRWRGGLFEERKKLVSCYKNALQAAVEHGCESIAFPLISSGTFGFPKDKVLRIALDTVASFLMSHDLVVYIVVFDKKAYAISQKLQKDVQTFIDEHYIEQHRRKYDPYSYVYTPNEEAAGSGPAVTDQADHTDSVSVKQETVHAKPALTIEEILSRQGESFSDALLRFIDESGMKDAECYKKANISKQHFSKIRSNVHYQPTKQTVLAFAIVLKLTLDETKELLEKAGLALSSTNKTDLIVEYFISNKKYDLTEINEVLDKYDQKCLGNVIA